VRLWLQRQRCCLRPGLGTYTRRHCFTPRCRRRNHAPANHHLTTTPPDARNSKPTPGLEAISVSISPSEDDEMSHITITNVGDPSQPKQKPNGAADAGTVRSNGGQTHHWFQVEVEARRGLRRTTASRNFWVEDRNSIDHEA